MPKGAPTSGEYPLWDKFIFELWGTCSFFLLAKERLIFVTNQLNPGDLAKCRPRSFTVDTGTPVSKPFGTTSFLALLGPQLTVKADALTFHPEGGGDRFALLTLAKQLAKKLF